MQSSHLEEETSLTYTPGRNYGHFREVYPTFPPVSTPESNYQEPPAKMALRLLGTNALPALVKALKSSDNKVSDTAADVLGEVGLANKEAVSALVAILRTRESSIHKLYRVAWQSMPRGVSRRLPKPQTPQPVANYWRDYWCYKSSPACLALDRLAAKARKSLRHPDDGKFWNLSVDDVASRARHRAKDGDAHIMAAILAAMPTLVAAVKDRDDIVSLLAIVRLGRIGPEAGEAVPALIYELRNNNRDTQVRQCAATMLAEIGSGRADVTEALMSGAAVKDRLLRCAAVAALGKCGHAGKEAIPLLMQFWNGNDKVLEYLAYDSLVEA